MLLTGRLRLIEAGAQTGPSRSCPVRFGSLRGQSCANGQAGMNPVIGIARHSSCCMSGGRTAREHGQRLVGVTAKRSRDDQASLERIQQLFDARAAGYDDDLSYHMPLAKSVLRLADLKPGEAVLDMACGTGLVLIDAARVVGPDGVAVGIDISSCMLAKAQAKVHALGLHNVVTIQCDIEDSEARPAGLAPGGYDAITCSAAIPFLRRPLPTLNLWRTWLSPNGRLAFNAFQSPNVEFFDVFVAMAQQRGLQYADPAAELGTEKLLRDALSHAGFASITVETETRAGRPDPAGDTLDAQALAAAERIWKIGCTMNVLWGPVDEAVLPGPQLTEFHDEFVAQVVERFVASRQNAGATRGSYTVFHACAHV